MDEMGGETSLLAQEISIEIDEFIIYGLWWGMKILKFVRHACV